MSELTKTCAILSVETGLPCQKANYYSEKNQEYWEHAGGHLFMSDETNHILKTQHINDPEALLSGGASGFHAPEECPGPPKCWHDSANKSLGR